MKHLLTLFVLVLAFSACKKDDPVVKTKTELITTGSWYFEEGGVDNDGNGTIDIQMGAGFIEACILDNYSTFSAGGTGVANEGPTKCDPAAPQTTPFTWVFTNNETEISFIGMNMFGLGSDFEVKALTETRLTLAKDTTLPGIPLPRTLIAHFKH